MNVPSLEEFLAAPDAEVAAVAPETIVYAPAGTKRIAFLEGVSIENYSSWAIVELAKAISRFFHLGVKHIFVPTLAEGQLQEQIGDYGKQIIRWIANQATSPELEAIAKQEGFRVRLIGPALQHFSELQQANTKLASQYCTSAQPTMWMYVVGDVQASWNEILQTAVTHSLTNRGDLARCIYGEDIQPVTMMISFGRLVVHPQLIPLPLYEHDVHCYWTELAGFGITDTMIRRMIYDAVFARTRDKGDRASRYDHLNELGQRWNGTSILGVGHNNSGFWFPDPFPQDTDH